MELREKERVRIMQKNLTESTSSVITQDNDDEDNAWSKVTPVGSNNFDSPETRSRRGGNSRNVSSKQNSFLKPANLSEGEMSDDSDCQIEV